MAGRMVGTVVGVALLVAVAPEGVGAQEAGWWEWALRDVIETRERVERYPGAERTRDRDGSITLGDVIFGRGDRDGDRGGRKAERRGGDRGRGGQGGAPAFCRTGEGHPVFGRQWCRDRGFGLGSQRGARWEDGGWGDVILRAPRERDRRSGTVDRGGLIDVLGDVVYRRLVAENRRAGGSEPLTGRWLRPGGIADVLQIRSGSVPVAELSDLDGDGRVDAVLVARP